MVEANSLPPCLLEGADMLGFIEQHIFEPWANVDIVGIG